MNCSKDIQLNGLRERGMASLFTAVVLMIGATLVLFTAAKLSQIQLKFSSNTYRTSQSFEAAQAGVDQGLALFNRSKQIIPASLISPDLSAVETYFTEASCKATAAPTYAGLTQISGTATGYFFFANTGADDLCGADGETDSGTLYAFGFSDDCSASRRISVCVGVVPTLRGGAGPKQPFVTKGGLGSFGNARIANRFTNITIWAGGSLTNTGQAFSTMLRDSQYSKDDLSIDQLLDETLLGSANAKYVQAVSDSQSGLGIDVVTNDPTLDDATPKEFWEMFFGSTTKSDYYGLHGDSNRFNTAVSDAKDNNLDYVKGGFYWLGEKPDDDPNAAPPSTVYTLDQLTYGGLDKDPSTYESQSDPMILVVNGDLELSGNIEFYGMLYVRGKIIAKGGPRVYGSVIAETGEVDEEASLNQSNGSLDLIYTPISEEGHAGPEDFTAGIVVPGSWRDW